MRCCLITKTGLGTKCLLLSGYYRNQYKQSLTKNGESYSCPNNTHFLKFSGLIFVILGLIFL